MVSDHSRNMRVTVQSYKPSVVCVGYTASFDIRGSCLNLLDSMSVDKAPIKFGYTKDSSVRLPYSRVSGELIPILFRSDLVALSHTVVVADGLCVVEIDTSGVVSDMASWRDFWEVLVALNGMCIRGGREGFQINIGTCMYIASFSSSHFLMYSCRCRWGSSR